MYNVHDSEIQPIFLHGNFRYKTLTMFLCRNTFTNEGDSISNVHIESLSSVEAKPLFSYCQHLLIQLHNINKTLDCVHEKHVITITLWRLDNGTTSSSSTCTCRHLSAWLRLCTETGGEYFHGR